MSQLKAQFVTASLFLANSLLKSLSFLFWYGKRPANAQKICIYRVGQIGDIVCAIPAMLAIRRAYPNAELTLLTSPGAKGNPGAKELLSNSAWIDHLWVYHSEDINSPKKILSFIEQLGEKKFDAWFELPQDLTTLSTELRNMFFAKLAGVKWASGYSVTTLPIFFRSQLLHIKSIREADRLLNSIKKLDIDTENLDFSKIISAPEKSVVAEIFEQHRLDKKKLVAMVPGGKRLANRWPVENFAEIARRWVKQHGQVIILGGPADYDLAKPIEEIDKQSIINLCGKTNLLQTAELLKSCSVLLTNDTGPMHIAAVSGVTCVVPFSARDLPVKWFPWGTQHAVIRKDAPCSPCFVEECPINNFCLRQVSVDEIWSALVSKTETEKATV
jgi:ADP-heptose:LPS heptosyltransferase